MNLIWHKDCYFVCRNEGPFEQSEPKRVWVLTRFRFCLAQKEDHLKLKEGWVMGAFFEKYQWNYKVLKEPIPNSEGEIMELEKKLSDLGSRYWEVVSVNHLTNSPNMLIYLKSTKWRTIVSKDH